MTTPSIQFRDSFGSVTITALAPTLNSWLPDVDEVSDRQVPQGTGLEEFWRYRRDFWAGFEMGAIPAASLGDLHRLKSHLLTGGFITVNTNDAASRVYTCSVKPGSTPSWSLTDRVNYEYTLSLEVRNVMPYPMLCDYSATGGTSADMITNGGGETGTVGSQATGWAVNTGTAGLLVSTAQAFFGSRSLDIHTSDSSTQKSGQGVTLAVGRYALSGWIKTTPMTVGGGRGALLDCWPSASTISAVAHRGDTFTGSLGGQNVGVAATGSAIDWTHVWTVFDCTSAGAASIYVWSVPSGASDAWFDGVRLEKVPQV